MWGAPFSLSLLPTAQNFRPYRDLKFYTFDICENLCVLLLIKMSSKHLLTAAFPPKAVYERARK